MSDENPSATLERPKYKRILYEYQIPKQIAAECGHVSFSMVRLSGEEEITAADAADNSRVRLQHMLCMYALKSVDGTPVNPSDGKLDEIFNAPDAARMRTLMISAYNDLHAVAKADMEALAKGRTVSYL